MSDTPETDAMHGYISDWVSFAQKLERERDEVVKTLSTIHRFIERNHPDGFIDSLTYSQNLERVNDRWYARLSQTENERDEVSKLLKITEQFLDLLGEELHDTAVIASLHGWKSTRIEQGKVLREKIKQLKERINEN
jgi:hypothetical protein